MRKDVSDTIKEKVPVTQDATLEVIIPQVDVLYVTRIQKERFPDAAEYAKVKGAYKIDQKTLKEREEGHDCYASAAPCG